MTTLDTDTTLDGTAPAPTWLAVCRLDDLARERGVAALVPDGPDGRLEQVALFRLVDDTVLAVDQLDPFSGAHVISRGIVGTRAGRAVVVSPMHKQAFDLRTGRCLDDTSVAVPAYDVVVADGVVLVGGVKESR